MRLKNNCYNVKRRLGFEASAAITAKVIIEKTTKHTYLTTSFITDEGTACTSKSVDEIARTLGLPIEGETTKHPQTIGKLEHI